MPPGTAQDERDAGDRAVLHALGAGCADDREAARLQVEHRAALRVAHQRLRAGAGGEAHLHASRCVGGRQKRLRPGRVVTVGEHRFGAVHGEGLGVRDEAPDGELQVPALLDGALRHHTRAAGLGADEERDRVQRCVARDTHGRLHLGEPPGCRLGRIGREQRRVLLQVGHVRLVARYPARPELLQREHQLHRIEHPRHARQLRRRQTTREPDEVGSRDIDVDQPPCHLDVGQTHRLRAPPGDPGRARRRTGRRRRSRLQRGRPSARRGRPRARAPVRDRSDRSRRSARARAAAPRSAPCGAPCPHASESAQTARRRLSA